MRFGLDRYTGAPLQGWPHCVQCIEVILTTHLEEFVMLRNFGNPALQLQDANATTLTIMQVFVGVADALRQWEPGFQLMQISLERAGADGKFGFLLGGLFFPNGHLKDYSLVEERSQLFAANDSGFVALQEAA